MAMSGAAYSHRKLLKLGIESDLLIFDGLYHGFMTTPDFPEAQEGYEIAATFVTVRRPMNLESPDPRVGMPAQYTPRTPGVGLPSLIRIAVVWATRAAPAEQPTIPQALYHHSSKPRSPAVSITACRNGLNKTANFTRSRRVDCHWAYLRVTACCNSGRPAFGAGGCDYFGARLARMRCNVRRCMFKRRAVSETLRLHSS